MDEGCNELTRLVLNLHDARLDQWKASQVTARREPDAEGGEGARTRLRDTGLQLLKDPWANVCGAHPHVEGGTEKVGCGERINLCAEAGGEVLSRTVADGACHRTPLDERFGKREIEVEGSCKRDLSGCGWCGGILRVGGIKASPHEVPKPEVVEVIER